MKSLEQIIRGEIPRNKFFRDRVEIQKATETIGDGGDISNTWAKVKDAWASIRPISDFKRTQFALNEVVITHEVVINYIEGFKNDYRFIKGNDVYIVNSFRDYLNTHKFLICNCNLEVNNGRK